MTSRNASAAAEDPQGLIWLRKELIHHARGLRCSHPDCTAYIVDGQEWGAGFIEKFDGTPLSAFLVCSPLCGEKVVMRIELLGQGEGVRLYPALAPQLAALNKKRLTHLQ